MIGYALCGSFCTHKKSIEQLQNIVKEYDDIIPIVSEAVFKTDTRFGRADELIKKLEDICNKKVISTIKDAEPIGPKTKLELLIISPCTGNTLAKIANGITDTPVTMAAKAHLRSNRPLLIALASNDAMSANLENIGKLLTRKNIYFVPLVQDDPINKPHSLVADFNLLPKSTAAALSGIQLRPLFL